MQPTLTSTLAAVARAMADARHDWWVIGSAAVALHGGDAGTIGDVDILLSETDAIDMAARHDMARQAVPSDHFRSAQFARWEILALPVEFMAGFEIATATGWHPVELRTRVEIYHHGARLFVPSRTELIDLLRLLDRPKDHRRARSLQSSRTS